MQTSVAVFVAVGCFVGTFGMTSEEKVKLLQGRCSSYQSYSSCTEDAHCSWCGNQTMFPPFAVCYHPSADSKCCVFNESLTEYCGPEPTFCNSSDVCTTYVQNSGYGPCGYSLCCPRDKPIYCATSGTCGYANRECCGYNGQCAVGETCCGAGGGPGVNTVCCQLGGTCCTAPDGMENWCCDAGTTCDENTGGCTPNSD